MASPIIINSPKKVYVTDSRIPNGGRGVFAAEEIKKGEVVEVAPVLILNFNDFVDTKWNLLFEYYFWMDKFVVLTLGYGGLYNHSYIPNISYKISKKDRTITFTALRDILVDEEICFNYKGASKSNTPLWFERK